MLGRCWGRGLRRSWLGIWKAREQGVGSRDQRAASQMLMMFRLGLVLLRTMRFRLWGWRLRIRERALRSIRALILDLIFGRVGTFRRLPRRMLRTRTLRMGSTRRASIRLLRWC